MDFTYLVYKTRNKIIPFQEGDLVVRKKGFDFQDPAINKYFNIPHRVIGMRFNIFRGWIIYLEDSEGFGWYLKTLERFIK